MEEYRGFLLFQGARYTLAYMSEGCARRIYARKMAGVFTFWKGILSPLLVLVVLAFGMRHFLHPDLTPGDFGDNRFNMYVLEHGYQWLGGHVYSFWSAPFFYPTPNVTAYSDNHLGNLPFYVPFRLAGLDRENAFQAWMALCAVLNFTACLVVLRRFGANLAGALAGAYLFAFGLPSISQLGHAQLLPRYFLPVAFLALSRFLRDGRPIALALTLAALAWQMYSSIYLGFFLGLGLFLLAVVHLLRGGAVSEGISPPGLSGPSPAWREGLRERAKILAGKGWGIWARLALMLAALASLAPLMVPYAQAARTLGMRNMLEIEAMLPRLHSWFYAPGSLLWSEITAFGDNLPAAHEHALFAGLAPWLAILALPWLARRKRPGLPAQAMAFWWVLAAAGLLTLSVQGASVYKLLIVCLPGVGAIRSVTRIVLVLLFPMAVILSTAITCLTNWLRERMALSATGLAVASGLVTGAVLLDQTPLQVRAFSKDEARARVEAVKTATGVIDRHGILFLGAGAKPGETIYYIQLDAMLAAQDMSIPTINGFSGNLPPGYAEDFYALRGNICQHLEQWICISGGPAVYSRIVQPRLRCAPQVPSWPNQAQSPAGGLDFSLPCYPPAVDVVLGLSGPEDRGRWTDANLAPGALIRFSRPLPKSFVLTLAAQAFGPNIGKPVVVRAGRTEHSFVFTDLEPVRDVSAHFDTEEEIFTLEIIPPCPRSPAEMGMNLDARKLGILIRRLSIQ